MGDLDQVKNNQQASAANNPNDPMQGSVPPPSAPPPSQTPPPPPADDPPNNIPLQEPPKDKSEPGVGNHDIGIEKEAPNNPPPVDNPPADDSATIEISSPNPEIPEHPTIEPQNPAPEPTPEPTPPPPPAAQEPPAAQVDQTDVPINRYDKNRIEESQTVSGANAVPPAPETNPTPATAPTYPVPQAPPAPIKAGNPAAIITSFALLALLVGGVGGFFGFRYFDQIKTSADTIATPSPSPSPPAGEAGQPSAATSASTPAVNGSQSKSYSNSKYSYSFAYPELWFASTSDTSTDSLVVSADQASLTEPASNFKVDVSVQAQNGKTLKNWVEAYTTASNERGVVRELIAGGKTCYQQEGTASEHSISTYCELTPANKVLILRYSAPETLFGQGGNAYNGIINSLFFS